LLRIVGMALGTAAVAAGVIRVLLVAAVVAREDVSAQSGRAAVLNILHGPAVAGQHVLAEPVEILWAIPAKDVRYLGHGRKRGDLQVGHPGVDGRLDVLQGAAGQVGIAGRAADGVMAQQSLDEADVHAVFQQAGGIGVP